MIQQQALAFYQNRERAIYQDEACLYAKPHPALRPYISNYTLTFPTREMISEAYTVIPHGCATLVFGFKDQTLTSQLMGPATKAARVGDQAGSFDQIVIVEFQPAGLYAFLGFSQNELTDQHFSFDLLHAKLNQGMLDLLETVESVQALISGIDQLFLQANSNSYPSELAIVTKSIVDQAGNRSLKQLSQDVFYSERHLTRLFNSYLGMSPKTFSRLVRVNQTIRLLNAPNSEITKAYEATGYYDFSHFNRDFKQITGNTPQEYRRKMSDFYSEIAKF
ncbi:MAG: helix-turn-helix domain-containing protein [Enterococcus malodoratus]